MTTTEASLRPIRAILRAMLSPRSRVDAGGRALLTAIDAEVDRIAAEEDPKQPAEIAWLVKRLGSLYARIHLVSAHHSA
ncbi:hypothetical protein [Mycobacteroides chelonae]|nr:hypothetical protein [Mycobacteroides chelonae]